MTRLNWVLIAQCFLDMKRITTKSSNPNEERKMSMCRSGKCLFYAELTEEFNFDDGNEISVGPRLSVACISDGTPFRCRRYGNPLLHSLNTSFKLLSVNESANLSKVI